MRVQQNIYNFCKKSTENETKRKLFFMLGIPSLCEKNIWSDLDLLFNLWSLQQQKSINIKFTLNTTVNSCGT